MSQTFSTVPKRGKLVEAADIIANIRIYA